MNVTDSVTPNTNVKRNPKNHHPNPNPNAKYLRTVRSGKRGRTDIGLKDWHQEDQEELENGAHGGRIRNELGEERDITDPKLQTLDGTKRIQIST